MDLAYDQLQPTRVSVTPQPGAKSGIAPSSSTSADGGAPSSAGDRQETSIDKAAARLETQLESAFDRLSTAAAQTAAAAQTTTWGSTLGGFWSKVKQQGGVVLSEAGKDFEAVRMELDGMLGSTRNAEGSAGLEGGVAEEREAKAVGSGSEEMASSAETLKQSTATEAKADGGEPDKSKPKQTMLALLSLKAQAYIDELDRDLEKVESKAGSYLTKVGADLGAYLKEAVNIEAPTAGAGGSGERGIAGGAGLGPSEGEVLFNVPEDIRNQIYSTRLDAQLHALHTSPEPFLVSASASAAEPEYAAFASTFDASAHTARIAADLAAYPKLRTLMEQLVPAQVRYEEFWRKYYYMREQIAAQEQKRRDLMERATAAAAGGSGHAGEEKGEFDWDEDDSEDDDNSNNNDKGDRKEPAKPNKEGELAFSTSVKPNAPGSSRPSSEASYDLVSQSASAIDLPSNASSATSKHPTADKTAAGLAPTAAPQAKPAAAGAAPVEADSESDDDWE